MTVEEIINNTGDIENIATICRSKIYVLASQFKQMVLNDMEIEDESAWAQGIHEICNDVFNSLAQIYELTDHFRDLELYSIDPEKIKKREEYLMRLGNGS